MPGSDNKMEEDRSHLSFRDVLTATLPFYSIRLLRHSDGETIPSYALMQGFNSNSEPPYRAWPARAVLWKEMGQAVCGGGASNLPWHHQGEHPALY